MVSFFVYDFISQGSPRVSRQLWGRISSRGPSLGVLSRISSVVRQEPAAGFHLSRRLNGTLRVGTLPSISRADGAVGFRTDTCVDQDLRSSNLSAENPTATMDPRDTAPDSWEQEDDVEATIDGQLEPAFTTLNVNAKPFVPNVNAAEFVPAFAVKARPGNVDSTGEFTGTLGLP